MTSLSERDVARLRTVSLLLADHQHQNPGEIATWFGAMQAQDLASGLWSFGLRLPGWGRSAVIEAVERGEVLRTWTQRGTIHFVAAQDARWMLETCGSRMLRRSARRREQLGIRDADAHRAIDILRNQMSGGERLTRAEAVAELGQRGIDVKGPTAYHLLWYSSQLGVTCIGPNEGKQQTFVLLDDWAPNQRALSGAEALAELALRYFRSHGPTTRKDFAGWSGLTVKDVKLGIEGAGDQLAAADFDGEEVFMSAGLPERAASVLAGDRERIVNLLPGFDEFLLGYKNRSVPVPPEFSDRIIPGNNGVFQPTIMVDGRVVGTWKRVERKTRVAVTGYPFASVAQDLEARLREAVEEYGRYLGLEAEFVWASDVAG